MKIKGTQIIILCLLMVIGCKPEKNNSVNVINSDIDRFWIAFDTISKVSDSTQQMQLLEELYLSKGTPGLFGIIESKRYQKEEFLNMINKYPKFLNSVRQNTKKAKELATELEAGIDKFKSVYPNLKPAKIYFTIGAMRSGGTTLDSLVLIGSELAMVDEKTNISEFEGRMKTWAENYIKTRPLDNIILLNVHEYVHTQQKTIPSNLLYQSLYEGVAEFVSVKAMNMRSSSPAIAYGKRNPEVKETFEKEMFYNWTFQWLWSNNSPKDFGVRDLGYYIGYEICELYYESSIDKKQAIKEMIELNYEDAEQIDAFIDKTNFFSKPISVLRKEDENIRPKVVAIKQFNNNSQTVNPDLNEITIEFSEPLNGYNTGVDYGELGKVGFPKVIDRTWSKDSLAWTIKVKLEPEKEYQILISNNFRTTENLPLQPYLIHFKTAKK
ncbi:hypothetical protein IWQ47_000284 [Aquimarina sp. EL_43]|uniref:gliding motility protein GldB-related protein n=1 Tax=unclassified Aquimarina TaxID=2627091 RepID=UPI0018CAE43D|nr:MULTISPECIES: hypothetical protein [unclassified Aquimarina]MBG6129024.1 hypothetical protein [Aquimarina sp. EL_35]MBG6150088.1 hypothetical protein [Aquimarina sp. EL_32]MBG6167226.1 hypothetical protein [Aquimarina sp. EL_43]